MGSSYVGVESSSSSPNFDYDYDVFFNFRGEDTRSNFISHLHMALRLKEVNVFIDDKLKRGDQISESLLKSIERSRISIVIFSKDYASSTWCLDELVKIIECKKSKGQAVLPVFFMVDPSEVRKQAGGYGEALAKHEANKLMTNKIQPWKEALTIAAGLSGWDLANSKDEAELIQEIVKRVLSIVNPMQLLHVAKHPVGVDSRLRKIEELVSHIGSEGVNMVGMYGIGGIGKTTLAKALYNKIATQFEGCCFLQDVRREASKHGLVQLQETLLNEILKDVCPLKVVNRDRGITITRSRLRLKKVLIVLDDVDHLEQLEALVGGHDWFGQGSKIIVTTRNKHLLSSHGFDEKIKIQGLNQDHALELFSWHAFKKSHPSSNYLDLSKRATSYCKGLSLALVVLGSFLCARDQAEWNGILDGFENSLKKGIKDVLQLSFDGLEDKVKDIFLDISCFFVGEKVISVKKMLGACHLNLDFGIIVLMDLSLIDVANNTVQMHDLIQQMGHEIAYDESPNQPGKRSRLLLKKDVLEVLSNNSGTNGVKAIKLDLQNPTRLDVDPQAFRKMKNLRLLIVRNVRFSTKIKYLPNSLKWIKWHGFAHQSLPTCFITKNIVGLDLQHSFIKRFEIKRLKDCERLKHVDFSYSSLLEQIPDFSAASNLEELYLINCTNLRTIHNSVFSLAKLTVLNLDGCSNLKKLPRGYFMLSSLKELTLSYCKNLEKIPDLSAASNLKSLYLQECTNLRMIHESVGSMDKLEWLDLRQCTNLVKLPSYLRLKSLEYLGLSGCCKLESFPKIAENMKSLRALDLDFTAIKELPSSIGYFTRLCTLHLTGCTNLISLPNTIYLLRCLKKLFLSGCSRFEIFPHKWDPTIQPVWSPLKIMETASGSLEFPHLLVSNESLCPHFILLDLQSCNISNANFLEILCDEAPFLCELDLSENKFSSLPSCLHKFKSLWNLELRNCKFLQEIPNLPQNIQNLDANGCESLARGPDNIVDIISKKQDLTLGEISREFLLTDTEVPEWFSYKTTSNLVSASFRYYPDMERTLATCVSFKVNGDSSKRISCNIFICNRLHCSFSRPFLPSKSEYLWLVTTSLVWGSMEVQDWNEILVCFEVDDGVNDISIRSYGVHVNEEIHGIQTDVKRPMVNYADFYQLEKLENLDIEDVLVKRFFEKAFGWRNSRAMLHAGYYDPKAIIDSNIQPMIFPLHLTYNGYTVICGMEGMGDTALANSLCNKFKWMNKHPKREALDNSTGILNVREGGLHELFACKSEDDERGANITTHTTSSKSYFISFRETPENFEDIFYWILSQGWIVKPSSLTFGRDHVQFLIKRADISVYP